MKISKAGIEFLKQCEGLRLKAYDDRGWNGGGVTTIGYGHTKTAKPNMVITKDEAENLLKTDLVEFERLVNKVVSVPLEQHEYDALVAFVFNIGTKFATSTCLKRLNANRKVEAANELRRWVYDAGKVSQGLVNRREKERRLFLDGNYGQATA